MSASTVNKLLMTCAFAVAALSVAPAGAQSGTRNEVRAIEQEYARQSNGRAIPDDQLEYYLDRSHAGWPMTRISQDMADTRRMSPNNPWRAQQGWAATAVVCSSVDNRYRECAVPFRGTAAMTQQISDSDCVEGRTWGQKQGMVWVNQGCRARFTMVPDARTNLPAQRQSMVCKSQKGARTVCNTGMNSRMRLMNRFKRSGSCVEGRTWGQRGNQIWVSDNCRARFTPADMMHRGNRADGGNRDEMGGHHYAQDGSKNHMGSPWARDPSYSVNCSSESRQQRCDWDARYGTPRVVQRTSRADCVQGKTWGYSERDGLWVSGGCRARFGAR